MIRVFDTRHHYICFGRQYNPSFKELGIVGCLSEQQQGDTLSGFTVSFFLFLSSLA